MARCVLIVDSSTGELVDAPGNGREGGRYRKFVGRILSLDANPVLDYGRNGGDTLTVSNNGGKGKAIRLEAETVYVSDNLLVNGKTIKEIASGQSSSDGIVGKKDQVSVAPKQIVDPETGKSRDVLEISLSDAVIGRLLLIDEAIGRSSRFVTKSEIASAIADLRVDEDDGLEEVKGTLRVLLTRLGEIVYGSSSDSPDTAE